MKGPLPVLEEKTKVLSNFQKIDFRTNDRGEPVEIQDRRKITYHFRRTYGIYPNFNNKGKPEDANM
jgi:hypothetical protein